MKVVTLASVRGAPGVTTASLLLASTFADGLVVEADLDGGVLAIRYGLGREPGLTTFAAAGPGDGSGWTAHAQDAGGVPVLVGPDAPSASAALWRTAGDRITRELVASDGVAVGRRWTSAVTEPDRRRLGPSGHPCPPGRRAARSAHSPPIGAAARGPGSGQRPSRRTRALPQCRCRALDRSEGGRRTAR